MSTSATTATAHADPHDHAHDHDPYLAHHFETKEQQDECATLGMWLFLAQEVMFFSGMFMAYAVYRFLYADAWGAGSESLSRSWGAINTIVLLLSSFTVALSVYFTQTDQRRKAAWCLVTTLILGIAFVVIKWFFEWAPKIEAGVFPGTLWGINPADHHYGPLAGFAEQNHLHLFFVFYYIMTGMHAFHMLIGFGLLLWLIPLTFKGKFGPRNYMTIMNFGLYWHFVDIVWVFLFPMFYLIPPTGIYAGH